MEYRISGRSRFSIISYILLASRKSVENTKHVNIIADTGYNDIRITAPNLEIDPDLKDSRGYNIDIGIRGKYKNFLNFDTNGFYLSYNDRIGLVTRTRADNSTYLISTNIANSRNMGIETFTELNVIKAINADAKQNLLLFLFLTYSYIDAKYVSSEKDFLTGNKVETAPNNILRAGLTYKVSRFSTTFNYSNISKQFSDANNTIYSPTGSIGIVPAYYVMDWSSKVNFKPVVIGISINNITNNKYFTRRATTYPGPGIIPAEPRTFLLSIELKL